MSEVRPERIIARREAMGLSQAKLGELSGASQASIQRIEAGETRSPRNLLDLARALRTTPEYLTGGSEDPQDDGVSEARLPYKAPADHDDMVQIAEIDLRFGLGGALMDQEVYEQHVETMGFPRAWVRYITDTPAKHLYWARGQGNSMEPNIGDGDVILIDRSQQTPGFGDLYWAIAYGQTGMIKRLRPMPDGSVKILSDNPNVPPEVAYDGELHVFGRVIAVVRRI